MLGFADVVRALLLFLLCAVGISNLFFLKRLSKVAQGTEVGEKSNWPFVSVLIPARNEEANIEKCVLSLMNQDYPAYEVIVLDDCSTDDTPNILRRLLRQFGHAKGDTKDTKKLGKAGDSSSLCPKTGPNLRVLRGKPLPSGWLGKHWACHQLAQVACGHYLLFTDADTEHEPYVLRDVVKVAFATKADLVTGLPREITLTWAERLVVPVIGWAVCGLLPFGLAFRLPSRLLCLGVGQFMFFRRSAFEAIGGYEAIRQEAVDDVALARRIKQAGYRWRFFDLTDHVSCRMYSSLRHVLDGLGKSVFPALGYRTWLLLVVLALLGWVFVAPPVVLVAWLFGVQLAPEMLLWNTLAIVLALWSWLIAMARLRYPWYQGFLYPLIMAMVMYLAMRSFVKFVRGEATWKGRVLPRQHFEKKVGMQVFEPPAWDDLLSGEESAGLPFDYCNGSEDPK